MKMLTFCSLVLLSPDRLCVEVIFFPLLLDQGISSYSLSCLLVMMNTFCNSLSRNMVFKARPHLTPGINE